MTKPTIAELSLHDLHDLHAAWNAEAALTVHYALLNDHDRAHAHACEAKRHERAYREHLWRDSQADENGAAK